MTFDTSFETGKKKKEKRPLALRLLRFLFNLAFVLTVIVAVAVIGLYFFIVEREGDALKQRYPALVENSYVFDRNGDEIGEIVASEDRRTVSSEDLGEFLPRAVTAVEDRRFEDHVGVDFEGLARAGWTDLRAGEVEEGGSTITEQLMKNLFVPEEDRFRVSFWRRFVQASLAFSYERNHTKEEILTTYLNAVYFGNGAYGAEIASERYFGKSARELTLPEAATLAGFLHAPSTYRAAEGGASLKNATERRDEVLRLMEEQGEISHSERMRARGTPLDFDPEPAPDHSDYAPFVEKARREAEDVLGEEALRRGGLRIHTTLDPEMQQEAIDSTQQVLYAPDDPSAAVVSVEPQNGAIRALAGENEGFNLALDARRQPGSAFKPVILAAALRRDISPESIYLSGAVDLSGGSGEYVINNYDYAERGDISLYEAMAQSDNTVFVRLGLYLGMKDVTEMASELGINSPLKPVPATAIGGSRTGVSPLEMASVYATLAGGGIHREPYAVEHISSLRFGERESVYDHTLVGKRVMSGNQAAAATDVLRGVVEDGTASNFHDLDEELGRPSAGKTGTTDDFVDAWYAGYTPRLATAVWVGYPEGNRSMAGVHGLEEAGGETLPLDLWASYMDRATDGQPALDFPEPNLSRMRFLDRGYFAAGPVGSEVALGAAAATTP